MTFVDFFMVI